MTGAVAEQFDRLVSKRQRRNLPDHLTADYERLATRRQDRHGGGSSQQVIDKRGAGFQ
jgi:hypothetical protein